MARLRRRRSMAMEPRSRVKLIMKHRKCSLRVTFARKKKTMERRKKRFLDLPAEIREKVYKNLLVSDRPIKSENMFHKTFGYFGGSGGSWKDSGSEFNTRYYIDRPDIHGAIVRTNRQIASEARAVLYGCNKFVTPDLTKAKFEFAFHLMENASLIKRLKIERYSPEGRLYDRPTLPERNTEFKLAAEWLTGLKSLKIGGLVPFNTNGKVRFPDIGIIRDVVKETGLNCTYTHRDHEQVRFAVENERQKGRELAFDVIAEIRKHNKAVAATRMATMAENRRWEQYRDEQRAKREAEAARQSEGKRQAILSWMDRDGEEEFDKLGRSQKRSKLMSCFGFDDE